MKRLLFIMLILFCSTHSRSQSGPFSQRVSELFFGVDISNKTASLFDSLLAVPQLRHSEKEVRQWNLHVAMEMKAHKAWSSGHQFSFSASPLPGLEIESGTIEVTLGETESVKKLLGLNWYLQFRDKVSATKYFDKIQQLFCDLATKTKIEKVKDVGDLAQFSTRNPEDTGIRDITLFLYKSPTTKKYQIALVFGTEFIDK